MPTEQGLGLEEEPTRAPTGEESAQSGEQRPVRWSEHRAGHLATQDDDFVAEHDDLDGQFLAATQEEPEQVEDPDERDIEKGQRHDSASPPSLSTKVRLS
jgi:hypothetical protein